LSIFAKLILLRSLIYGADRFWQQVERVSKHVEPCDKARKSVSQNF